MGIPRPTVGTPSCPELAALPTTSPLARAWGFERFSEEPHPDDVADPVPPGAQVAVPRDRAAEAVVNVVVEWDEAVTIRVLPCEEIRPRLAFLDEGFQRFDVARVE